MKLAFFITAASFASATAAIAMPNTPGSRFSLAPNAPNGFSTHVVNADGSTTTEYIGDVGDLPSALNSTINTVQLSNSQGDISCRNQYVLNLDDLIAAEQGLEAMYTNGGSFNGKSTSYKSGSAVAYGCNYGKGQTITGTWLSAQYNNIAQQCGSTGPGWVSYPDWKASYGVDSSATGFC
jgi:hypothetical protein